MGICGFVAITPVQAYQVPPVTGYVNDFANLLDPEVEQGLETQLSASAEKNQSEVRVVTVQSLQGETAESVSQQFFKAWDMDLSDQTRSVIILVAVQDQALEIFTSQGLQPALDASIKETIISEEIVPAFNSTDYYSGIQAGVNTILLYLDDPSTIMVPTDDGTSAAPIPSIFTSFMWLIFFYSLSVAGILGVLWSAAHLSQARWHVVLLLGATLGGALGQIHGVGVLTALPFAAIGAGFAWIVKGKYAHKPKQ